MSESLRALARRIAAARTTHAVTPPYTTFTVPGAPRTKKNHGARIWRKDRRGRSRAYHVPSEAFSAWQAAATIRLAPLVRRGPFPIPKAARLGCCATFYRDAAWGDAVGYYQGLADLLQHVGVLEDDVSIVHWDGSRLLVDRTHPRTVVVLTVLDAGDR